MSAAQASRDEWTLSVVNDFATACESALAAGEEVPDADEFVASRSGQGRDLRLEVRRVSYPTTEAARAAEAEARAQGCRLVCREMQGGTDCFWVCPRTIGSQEAEFAVFRLAADDGYQLLDAEGVWQTGCTPGDIRYQEPYTYVCRGGRWVRTGDVPHD